MFWFANSLQAESCSDNTSSAKMQVYLSKAGMLLAPDSFMLAMDGEAAFREHTFSQCSVEMLDKRVEGYEKGIGKIVGHLKRLEGANEKERYVSPLHHLHWLSISCALS